MQRFSSPPSCRRAARASVTLGVFLCLIPQPALAYLDPGVGSMLVQGIIAGIAALSSALFILRVKLRQLWNRLIGRSVNTIEKSGKDSEPRNE